MVDPITMFEDASRFRIRRANYIEVHSISATCVSLNDKLRHRDWRGELGLFEIEGESAHPFAFRFVHQAAKQGCILIDYLLAKDQAIRSHQGERRSPGRLLRCRSLAHQI